MGGLVLAAMFLVTASWGHAADPAFEWARAFAGQGASQVVDMATDPTGNIYLTGSFAGTVDFNPGQGIFSMTAIGNSDIFVVKLDSSGGFVWARAYFGPGANEALAIAVDDDGNVYTTGRFFGSADFDPNTTVFGLSAPGGQGIFTAKLDTDGNFVWANAMGDTNSTDDTGYGIAVDREGSVYSTGSFSGTTDFDTGPIGLPISALGASNIFVRKLASDGSLAWAKAFRGTSPSRGRAITVDREGNVYFAGQFRGTVDFDPGPVGFLLTALGSDLAGDGDAFAAKLNPDGELIWARAFGGTLANTAAYGIAVDPEGGVFITGAFMGTTDFDPGPASHIRTSGFLEDAFVVKLTPDGDLDWAHAIGNPGSQQGHGAAVDALGAAYVVGEFQGTVDFDPGPGTVSLTAANGVRSAFVWKLERDGSLAWARATGGAGSSAAQAVTLFPGNRVVTTGAFVDTVDFNPGLNAVPLSTVPGNLAGFSWALTEGDAVAKALTGAVSSATTGGRLACAVVELTAADGTRHVSATGRDGGYFFEPLPPGVYAVRVFAPGFVTQEPESVTLAVAAPIALDVALEPAPAVPSLFGQVTDADTGDALAGVRVVLRIGGVPVADTLTCGAGQYAVPIPLAKQDETVDAEVEYSLENYETKVVEAELASDEDTEVNAAMEKRVVGTAALAGAVTGAGPGGNTPLVNARITLRGPVHTAVDTGTNGAYGVDALLDGPYIVTASAPGYEAGSVWRQLQGGATSEASFVLEPSDTPPPTVPGDINGDGVVNAADVQLVINAALGIPLDPGLDADINGDGVVNAVDVQLVINAALGIPI